MLMYCPPLFRNCISEESSLDLFDISMIPYFQYNFTQSLFRVVLFQHFKRNDNYVFRLTMSVQEFTPL